MTRTRKTYESPDMSAMIQRVSRGLVRRAANGDLEALRALYDCETAIHTALADAALEAHDGSFHYSWNQIGEQLGLTRQAVQQRFAKHLPRV